VIIQWLKVQWNIARTGLDSKRDAQTANPQSERNEHSPNKNRASLKRTWVANEAKSKLAKPWILVQPSQRRIVQGPRNVPSWA